MVWWRTCHNQRLEVADMICVGGCNDWLFSLRKDYSKKIQTIVTSPPYWGLRDYGIDAVEWNDSWVGNLGDEDTPEQFVQHLCSIFDKAGELLRDDGTLWVNIGDTYFGAKGGHWDGGNSITSDATGENYRIHRNAPPKHEYIKVKDLTGIPWKFAFAMQKRGWYLRQDIIWHKPNPMPEAVTDRCVKSHEYIFLFSQKPKYYFNHEVIQETAIGDKAEKRNRRSVWSINLKPSTDAHFAVYPKELPMLCIQASTKKGDIVLDPFGGSGTTGVVAEALGRKYILIEINKEYIEVMKKRLNIHQQDLFGGKDDRILYS